MRIAELFHSIQGESTHVGRPCVFVRLTACDLRCSWCDTPYASWDPEGPVLSLDEIINRVCDGGHQHVVITGGEPMLFDAVVPLAEELQRLGQLIQQARKEGR